jgi:hypothetical protein
MTYRCLICASLLFTTISIKADDDTGGDQTVVERTTVERLVEASGQSPPEDLNVVLSEIERQLNEEGEATDKLAGETIAAAGKVVADDEVVQLLDSLGKEKPVLAARLLVQVIRACKSEQAFRSPDKNTGIAVGQLIVEDELLDPTMGLAQAVILEEGYFATPVGSFEKPLSFRAHGYEDLDVALHAPEKEGGAVLLGHVTLKPLANERRASFRGKVVLDDAPDASSVRVGLNASMGPVNTPSGGYPGRPRWPEGLTAEVDENGEFTVEGLNPSKIGVLVNAEGHVQFYKQFTLAPGEAFDAGELRLLSSDLGFYVGHEPPETPELSWEPDYATALERAKSENRPLFVMMTATWCQPCSMLEAETLNNPWIRHFLSPFVMVKAYEDKEVEKKYGQMGYPTLAFCDDSGKLAFQCVGYEPPFQFAAECAKALKAVELELPADLQALIDKEIVEVK